MRVVYFFTYGYSLKTWYDSGTLLKELELYRYLYTKYKIKTTFITYGNDNDFSYDLDCEGFEVIPIYNYIQYHKNSFLRYAYSFMIPFYLNYKLKINCDIIKQNQLMGSWISILFKLLSSKPIIIRTGYDMLTFAIKSKANIFKICLYYLLTTFSLLFANLYTVTSTTDKKFINKYFKVSKKIHLRPNWVHINEPLTRNRIENRILSVGRLENQKNYKSLIKAVCESSFGIDIVGDGSLKESLLEYSSKLGVDLKIINPMQNEDLLVMYTKYKYFVLSSHYEGNPKVVLEAMASGCLAILSNIENHNELLEHGVSGYLFENNKDLINILNKLNDSIGQEKIIENSIERVRKNNSLDSLVRLNLDDFNALLGRSY
jgi:glycosyltransferase involved in cell wall biosynthesis